MNEQKDASLTEDKMEEYTMTLMDVDSNETPEERICENATQTPDPEADEKHAHEYTDFSNDCFFCNQKLITLMPLTDPDEISLPESNGKIQTRVRNGVLLIVYLTLSGIFGAFCVHIYQAFILFGKIITGLVILVYLWILVYFCPEQTSSKKIQLELDKRENESKNLFTNMNLNDSQRENFGENDPF